VATWGEWSRGEVGAALSAYMQSCHLRVSLRGLPPGFARSVELPP
jgi:hypothetical protein